MFHAIFLLIFTSLPLVIADGWDDFSNNLATDLAPFLSLFGEQVTKQYLSESVTKLDYIIFAIAPIGILTAVVSAIRVCGSSTLRAFIGRAQEGGGNAEAELCSSTSRDVCELFQNGGIARVFGRPKILEIIFDPEDRDSKNGEAGIYTFLDHVERQQDRKNAVSVNGNDSREPKKDKGWVEHVQGLGSSLADQESGVQKKSSQPASFAPNLSLNIGIQKQPPYVFWIVAITGFILQAGVLAFAGVITYHWQWERDGHRPDVYAFPLTLVGTLLVSIGIYWCAALVGDSTAERTFYNNDMDRNSGLSIYWIQPGGQIIGDQTFDAFAYSEADSKDPLREYIISQKNPVTDDSRSKPEIATWAAVVVTISGFVLQFTGLRGIHAVVPVAQLGVTLVMSMTRAALRMRRFKPEHNCLSKCPDQVIGYELDWLALHLVRKGLNHDLNSSETDQSNGRPLLRFRGLAEPGCRTSRGCPILDNELHDVDNASKVLAYRTRLASLTRSQAGQAETISRAGNFRHEMVAVRQEAQRLARAIQNTYKMFLTSNDIFIPDEWRDGLIYWAVSASLYKFSQCRSDETRENSNNPLNPRDKPLYIKLGGNGHTDWLSDLENRMEALLGLWIWSLKSDPQVEETDQYGFIIPQTADIRTRRIIAADENLLWAIKTHSEYAGSFTENELNISPNKDDPSILWKYNDSKSPAYYSPYLDHPKRSRTQLVRFFGWDVARSSKTQSTAVKNSNFSVWSVTSDAPILSLCAQEIFVSFFSTMLDFVHGFDRTRLKNETGELFSPDSIFSQTVAAFVDSGIGERRDALLCLLPPMVSHLDPPSTEDMIRTFKSSAIECQKQQSWGQAEEKLRRVWEFCKRSQHSEKVHHLTDIAIAFGELYREALMKNPRDTFVIDGIKWLNRQKSELLTTDSLADVENIINRYVYIADRVGGVDGQGSSSRSTEDRDERTLLLLSLTQQNPNTITDRNLTYAARNNWMEIVLALLEFGVAPSHTDANSRTVLSYAAEYGCVDVVSQSIAKDIQSHLNAPDNEGRTPLSWAAGQGHYDLVENLLSNRNVKREKKDHNGHTPLFWAAKNKHLKTVELLLRTSKGGTDDKEIDEIVKVLLQTDEDYPEAKHINKSMPMHIAAEHGYSEVAQSLLDKTMVDTRVKDVNGRTPLFLATMNEHWDIVELLLSFDDGCLYTKNISDRMLMHLAAECGYLKIATLLLKSNEADANARDKDGRTPTHLAAQFGHQEIVELLLDSDHLDANIKDQNELTPLFLAVVHGRWEIVQLLLKNNRVDANARDKDGRTPIHHAAQLGHKEIFQLLVQVQANKDSLNAKDTDGWTPMHLAAEHGHLEIVKSLLDIAEVDAEVMQDNRQGKRPLHWAALGGHLEIVESLLESGRVNLESPDHNKRTAMHHAATNGHLKIAKLLFEKGANPDVADAWNETPIYWTVKEGYEDVAEFLIQTCNIDLTRKNHDGDLPLAWAKRHGCTRAAELIN
ncbi:hypothetical protein E8E14_002132 [Neopestalotiopsis sp. 37M]|nr:hypothetical protein E8E14_002132 [Neopestalotiopsis sp. 37M]